MTTTQAEAMQVEQRFYIDCEFDGHGGEMLSMAVIREDGRGLYLCIADKPDLLDEWVEANVWPLVHLKLPAGRTVAFVEDWGHFIRSFIGKLGSPIIIADSPVDIWRFCETLSTGPNGAWESVNNPRLSFEVHNVDCYPTDLPGAVQHNAWWDAMALRHKLARFERELQRPADVGQIVAWLRDEATGYVSPTKYDLLRVADAIERGDYLRSTPTTYAPEERGTADERECVAEPDHAVAGSSRGIGKAQEVGSTPTGGATTAEPAADDDECCPPHCCCCGPGEPCCDCGKIQPGFTPAEVENLNAWQAGPVPPFTCGNDDHDGAYSRTLIATARGWICPGCDYTQDWAHDFMKDGSGLAAANASIAALQPTVEPGDDLVEVRKIETVTGDFGTEPGEPFWRIEINGYCADFDYEDAARNFAAQINNRAALRAAGVAE